MALWYYVFSSTSCCSSDSLASALILPLFLYLCLGFPTGFIMPCCRSKPFLYLTVIKHIHSKQKNYFTAISHCHIWGNYGFLENYGFLKCVYCAFFISYMCFLYYLSIIFFDSPLLVPFLFQLCFYMFSTSMCRYI